MQFTFSIFTLYLHLYFLVKQSGEGNHLSSIKPLIALSHQFVVINSYHIHKKKKSKEITNVFGFRCRFKWRSLYLQLWIFESSCKSACGHCFNRQHIFFYFLSLFVYYFCKDTRSEAWFKILFANLRMKLKLSLNRWICFPRAWLNNPHFLSESELLR